MLNDIEYKGLLSMLSKKVQNSLVAKASRAKMSVHDYLAYSDERYCLVLLNQNLLGVSEFDSDYRNYHTSPTPDDFKIEREGEQVMRECDALLNLTAFDKRDSAHFYKWGYSFSLDDDGTTLVLRSCNGRIRITPQASNSIEISLDR